MGAVLQGYERLERKLLTLGDPRRVKAGARNAIRAGQRVLVAGIKSKIPGRYKDARRAIGHSLKRARQTEHADQVVAKVGAAVGMKKNTRPVTRTRPGVGLSARNIHWAILGTGDRAHESGHPTGSMPAILGGVVKAGYAASSAAASDKIKKTLAAYIEKHAR
jgi:hypothetical protein